MKKLLLVSLVASIFALSHLILRAENIRIASYAKGPHRLDRSVSQGLENIFNQNYKEICLAPDNQKKQNFYHHVINTTNTLCVLSDIQKNILGFITFNVNETTNNSIHVELLAINKNHQKMGYGSTLLEHATQVARQQGMQHMDLLALSSTLSFYNKNGFKPIHNFDYQLPYENRSVRLYQLEKMV